jgi:hypothetical protein
MKVSCIEMEKEMKMQKNWFCLPLILMIALMGFPGCSSDSGSGGDGDSGTDGDGAVGENPAPTTSVCVYVCGTSIDSAGLEVPSLWKNGERSSLSRASNAKSGSANSLLLSGGSVYVAGATRDGTSGNPIPCYWESGARSDLTSSDPNGETCTDLTIADGHLYLSFARGSGGSGCFIDGTERVFNSFYTNEAGLGIAVSNGTVYVAGYNNGGTYYHIYPVYYSWDGTTVNTISKSEGHGSDILAAGTDIYFSGDLADIPTYWKNDAAAALLLPDGAVTGHTTTLAYAGSTLYVSGYTIDASGIETPCYWTVAADGTAACVQLSVLDTARNGRAQGIFAYQGVVYACGYTKDATSISVPCYWKAGSRVDLARLASDKDGTASSIAVTTE